MYLYDFHSLQDGKYYTSSKFGAGSGKIWLDDLACTSSTTKLLHCPSNPIGEHNCAHSSDIGVGCEGRCDTPLIVNNFTHPIELSSLH